MIDRQTLREWLWAAENNHTRGLVTANERIADLCRLLLAEPAETPRPLNEWRLCEAYQSDKTCQLPEGHIGDRHFDATRGLWRVKHKHFATLAEMNDRMLETAPREVLVSYIEALQELDATPTETPRALTDNSAAQWMREQCIAAIRRTCGGCSSHGFDDCSSHKQETAREYIKAILAIPLPVVATPAEPEAGCCRRAAEKMREDAALVLEGGSFLHAQSPEATWARQVAGLIRALPLPEQRAPESEANELLARFATEHDACKDALEPFVDRWAGRPLLDMVRDAVALLSAPESEGT